MSDFRAKNIIRNKEGHCIIVSKGPIYLEDIAVLNVYAPNKITTKYKKQKLI